MEKEQINIRETVEKIFSDMNENSMEKPEIKEYYLAYFDILGYKNYFIQYPEKAQEMLDAIYKTFNFTINRCLTINDVFSLLLDPNYKVKLKIFSDNVALCLDAKDINQFKLLNFIEQVKNLQLFFLSQGFPVRGALVKGKIAINNEFIFGPGLIDAVNKEQAEKFPRIIIDKKVIDDITGPIEANKTDDLVLEDLKVQLEPNPDGMYGKDLRERIDKSLEIINRILLYSFRIIDDTTSTEVIRLALLEEYKRIYTSENITINDFASFYINLQNLVPLVIKIGNLIINDNQYKTREFLQSQYNSTVAIEEKTNIYFINYLGVMKAFTPFKLNEIKGLITSLENIFGTNSPLTIETEMFLNEEKYLENLRNRFKYHKEFLIEKIKEHCNLNNVDLINEDEEKRAKSISEKKKIQNKYRWLLTYHNDSADRVSLEEFKIKCSGVEFEKTGICIMKEIN